MFTSRITDTIDIPDEPGQTITIRKLAHYQRMAAEDARLDAVAKKFMALGDSAKNLPGFEAGLQSGAAATDTDPKNKYDMDTVVSMGVVAWSYPDELTPDALKEQDWTDWAFDCVIAFSERSNADLKDSANGSQPSSVPAADVGLTN